MTTPLISVLIPMYNASAGVRPTLQSIINQTIDDYEVVIVDDGSTDDSVDIAYETLPGVRIISQKNSGITKSLNHGLEHCRGEFIARIDCNDTCLPDRFEMQLKALQEDPKLGAIGGHLLLYGIDGSDLGICKFPTSPDDALTDVLNGHSALPHSGAMIRKDFLTQIGGYDPFFNGREDVELWCRLSLVSDLSNLDQVVVRALSTNIGLSFEGMYKYPLVELALIERAERLQKGLQWVNYDLRKHYRQRISVLENGAQTSEQENKAYSIFYLKRAGFLHRSGNRSMARRDYKAAIYANPFAIRAYIGILSATVLSNSIYLTLLGLYKLVRRGIRTLLRERPGM